MMGLTDWAVMGGLLLTSGGYWVILDIWQKKDPDGYDANTWFLVVVGVGYVLLWSRLIVPDVYWQKIFFAFVVASIPIIARSLVMNTKRNVRTRKWLESHRDGDT